MLGLSRLAADAGALARAGSFDAHRSIAFVSDELLAEVSQRLSSLVVHGPSVAVAPCHYKDKSPRQPAGGLESGDSAETVTVIEAGARAKRSTVDLQTFQKIHCGSENRPKRPDVGALVHELLELGALS